MVRTFVGTMIAAVVVVACSSTPEPLPLSAARPDMRALAGEWIGEYHSFEESGRSGTLLFRLEAGQDTVQGDVLIHIAGRETASVIPFTTDPWANVSPEQILTITFVEMEEGGSAVGRVGTYHDPVCGCEVRTTFTGQVDGNLFEGTYTTVHINGADRTDGRWRVVRSFPD